MDTNTIILLITLCSINGECYNIVEPSVYASHAECYETVVQRTESRVTHTYNCVTQQEAALIMAGNSTAESTRVPAK